MDHILEDQDNLQMDARKVIESSGLMVFLEKLGKVTQTGSSVTGLMVYPDIDFTIQNDKPDVNNAINLIPQIYKGLNATKVGVADFRLDKNEGASYYLGIDFPYEGLTWHIDATVGKPGPIQTSPVELAKWLEDMSIDQRVSILKLKKQLIDEHRYVGSRSQPPYTFRSVHLYEGVLRGGANTVSELETYYKNKLS